MMPANVAKIADLLTKYFGAGAANVAQAVVNAAKGGADAIRAVLMDAGLGEEAAATLADVCVALLAVA